MSTDGSVGAGKASILVADDNPNNLQMIESMLRGFGYTVRVALDGEAALRSVQSESPELILLDIHMPKLDGYETCERLKANEKTRDIPVIFASAMDDQFNKIKGFQAGAVDYVTKPVQLDELRARIDVHLQLARQWNQLQEQALDLTNFNKSMLDREMRVIELKSEVNALAQELGRDPPYPETLD